MGGLGRQSILWYLSKSDLVSGWCVGPSYCRHLVQLGVRRRRVCIPGTLSWPRASRIPRPIFMLYRRVFEQSSSGCQREDKMRMAI